METQSSSRKSLRKHAGLLNYDEDLAFESIESHLGDLPKRRTKTSEDLQKETETEAMIAFSLGFPIDALLEDEIEAGVVRELGGQEQNDYIVLRNHILAKWRANVRSWLSKSQIMETVSSEYRALMSSAYDFLLSHGYINFGVSSSVKEKLREEPTEGTVLIVGGGLAGLAAARQLLAFGFKVLVLEGRRRPGGRVYTKKMGLKGNFAAVDLGGSVITGIHANPLGVLARQLSLPLHKVRDRCPLYKPDGNPVDERLDSKVEYIFNELLNKATQLRQTMGELAGNISLGCALETFREMYGVARDKEERQLLDWHLANLEYANAGLLSKLSVLFWDQDDPYEMGGDHCLLAGGNCRLIDALCEDIPILYEKIVQTIKYGSEGVEVKTSDLQVYQADMVLCTVPLGVLKNKSITFVPELPKRKLEAIERLGFGLLNKVAMVFPYVFWGEDLDTFGCLNEDSHRRGEFFLFYSYHMVSGGPLLIALVAGEAAIRFETTDPVESLHQVLKILRGIYGPKGVLVPDPIQSICTRWGSDPLCQGSYSHVGVGASGSDYDILAESAGNGRLFFAGEATIRRYPATMHGAFLSGLREASCILAASRNRHGDPVKGLPKRLEQCKVYLADLFRKPDIICGNFSFVFDPRTDDSKSLVLLRVTFEKCSAIIDENTSLGELRSGFLQHENPCLQLYAILTREQALELNLVSGEDAKLKFLYRNIGLKLVGVSGLGAAGNSLVSGIASSRRGRCKNLSAVV
ncbi:hypothetical protein AMTRI_Chr02g218900 [Amborella trichopoda]